MQMLKVAIAAIITFTGCSKQINNAAIAQSNADIAKGNIVTEPATYFDSMFTRFNKGQWTGGDVAYSHVLPDGRNLWLFGDSFVDTVFPNRTRPVGPFIHSTIVLTTPNGMFQTLFNGTVKNPKPFFEAEEPNQLWPNCAFLSKDEKHLYVLMVSIRATGEGGLFGFKTTGNVAGVLSLPDLELEKLVVINNHPKIDWSSTTYEEGDYVYIYGAEATDSFPYTKYMHISRTSRSNPLQNVEFYNGVGWSRDSSKSKRMIGGISQQYSVFKHNSKYYLLSQEGVFLSSSIYLWDAESPVGPFSRKRKIYNTPQAKGNVITYNAMAHPEFMSDGRLLVGYSTNSFDGKDLYKNADTYRPYFVWISNWQ